MLQHLIHNTVSGFAVLLEPHRIGIRAVASVTNNRFGVGMVSVKYFPVHRTYFFASVFFVNVRAVNQA
jgi:hypothetical protein